MCQKMYDNVFIAKVISFDEIYYYQDEYEMPFETELSRLVAVFDSTAYDLENDKAYHIIEMEDYIIPDEEMESLVPGVLYVYDMQPFSEVWESLKKLLEIDDSYLAKINNKIAEMEEYHNLQKQNRAKGKIIQFKK